MTCKLKLQNKGLYTKKFVGGSGGLPVLNLLQRLALDFTDIFVFNFPSDYLTDKCKENFKKGFLVFSRM